MSALVLGYGVYGAFWGAWAVVLVEYLDVRGLTLAAIGGLFSVTSVTAIATMTFGGDLMVRPARHHALAAAFGLAGAASLLVGVATGPWLAPAFAVLGVGIGMVDVLVNLAGGEIEAATDRPALQIIHAGYGAGGATGALLAATATTAGWLPAAVLVSIGLAHGLAAIAVVALIPHEPPSEGVPPPPGLALGVLRGRPDLQIAALVVLCAFFIEGSMDGWAVLFVRTTLQGPVMGAAVAFAAFALAITAGRLFAARVLYRLGRHATLLVSGAGSLVAGATVVGASTTAVAGGAFLLLGFFLSVAAPAAFGMVGGAADAGRAIAAITAVGYSGFVVGPPVMGWVGDRFGLRTALLALVIAPACMLLAAAVGERRRRQSARSARTAPDVPVR
ncbi:MAG TPA: MFS transporter [Euzebyales bacterium]